jgi:hypothetical protein
MAIQGIKPRTGPCLNILPSHDSPSHPVKFSSTHFTRRKESLPVNIFLSSHACSAPMWTASPTWNSTEHKPSNSTWRKPSWLSLPMLSFSGFFVDQRSKRKKIYGHDNYFIHHSKPHTFDPRNTRTRVQKLKFIVQTNLYFFCSLFSILLLLPFRFFCKQLYVTRRQIKGRIRREDALDIDLPTYVPILTNHTQPIKLEN